MKRYIGTTTIYGMSMDRSTAVRRLTSFNNVFYEHVCKCVLFGDTLHCYNHWIDDELANWLAQANDIQIKGNKKLKARDYQEYLFGGLGDSYSDARINLTAFVLNHGRDYPKVRADAYIQNMYEVSKDITETFSSILSAKNTFKQRDFINLLHDIMDRPCLQER